MTDEMLKEAPDSLIDVIHKAINVTLTDKVRLPDLLKNGNVHLL